MLRLCPTYKNYTQGEKPRGAFPRPAFITLKTINMPLTPIEVRKYVALVTQISTDDPTAVVLHNTLGGTVTWTRTNVGEYQCSGTGLFGAEKTTVIFGRTGLSRYIGQPQNDNVIYFETLNQSNFNADNLFAETPVEISVYYTETTPVYS